MPQSLVQIPVHIVFSTHTRKPLLNPADRRAAIFRYMGGICRKVDCPSIRINGMENHVHLLCMMGKEIPIATLIRTLKCSSSKWINEKHRASAQFHWQKGYGAFGVSCKALPQVIRYIDNQESHHRTISFEDEFRSMCKEAGLALDERFAWH
jgi:REP element-mobilizing transposase RayT